MIDQTQVIRRLEKDAMVKKEVLQNSENEIVKAKTYLELAKRSLRIAKDSARAQQLEFTSTKEFLKKAKDDFVTENELNKKSTE